MDSQIIVSNAAEIAAAMELIERHAASMASDAGTMVCPLICEELLVRLLDRGCSPIRVRAKRFPSRHIEIRAEGAQADAAGESPAAEGIGAQISQCLLE